MQTTIFDDSLQRGELNVDPAYFDARDNKWRPDLRDWIEELWVRFRPYCGDGEAVFLEEAKKQFNERMWEMYLGCVLLEHGYQLECPNRRASPDIKVLYRSKPLWIEAVDATPGSRDKPDNAFRRVTARRATDSGGVVESFSRHDDQIILRYTQALQYKKEQRESRIQAGTVKPEDPYVVAISGGQIPDADLEEPGVSPLIVQGVFGQESVVYRVPVDGAEPSEIVTESTAKPIRKRQGALVETQAFFDREYEGISAVLFCSKDILNLYDLSGSSMVLVHNPRAANRLDIGTFRFGREYWLTCISHDWSLPAVGPEETTPTANLLRRVWGFLTNGYCRSSK